MRACTLNRGLNRRAPQAFLLASLPVLLLGVQAPLLVSQDAPKPDLAQQVEALSQTVAHTQSQLEQSQRELNELRNQLAAMKLQLAAQKSVESSSTPPSFPPPAAAAAPAPGASSGNGDDLRERLAVVESQLATHEQSKVESDSKYSLKVSGLLLFNGFVNTSAVNLAATPTIALPGSGSTGASIRQTILGFEARGPRLFGARSFADLYVDFAGSAQGGGEAGSFAGPYSSTSALLRLRTAHASLEWQHTKLFFSLDRPLISPDTPTSLTAVAEPALAWSGNLWTWNPQFGVTHDFDLPGRSGFRAQAALIDVADSPFTPQLNATTTASTSEQSRWPGAEARFSFFRPGSTESDNHFGVGGYFAPHRLAAGLNFDSWAASLDANVHLPGHLEWTASAYRGRALGGLGGGVYKDIAYYIKSDGETYIRPLDDVGGWTQLKQRVSSRLEFNEAFGTDQVFAGELRSYYSSSSAAYQNLDIARTFTGNVLYRPNAYLLFSLEYRRIMSTLVTGDTAAANVFGLAAGYKF